MYFNKKHWKFIIFLYKYKSTNSLTLRKLAYTQKTGIPSIFINFSNISYHNGKNIKNIPIKFTGLKNK